MTGIKGTINLITPYVDNFKINPAKIIEPASGASAWALGNQMWKGAIGCLIAKLIKIPNHNQNWKGRAILKFSIYDISINPKSRKIVKKANNMNKDPNT